MRAVAEGSQQIRSFFLRSEEALLAFVCLVQGTGQLSDGYQQREPVAQLAGKTANLCMHLSAVRTKLVHFPQYQYFRAIWQDVSKGGDSRFHRCGAGIVGIADINRVE